MVISGPVHQFGKQFSEEADDTKNGHFRSGPHPSPRMHSFEEAKLQTRKKATGVRPGRDVDVSDGEQHSHEASVTAGKEPKTSKQGNSVHSVPNKKITDSVEDSPFSNNTGNKSNAKSSPKMKDTSKKAPCRKYYRPSMIPSNFRSTTKVTSSVYKTPNSFTSPTTKANCQAAGKHQSTKNQGQYHARPWRILRNYTPTHLTDLAA